MGAGFQLRNEYREFVPTGSDAKTDLAGSRHQYVPRAQWRVLDQLPDYKNENAHAKAPARSRCSRYRPSHAVLTEEHLITYLRLLDADAESTDWREAARITSWAAEIERPLLNS